MSGRVVHFEVPYDDADRARSFYSEVFGWAIQPVPEFEYNFVQTGPIDEQSGMPTEPGYIGGGMLQRQDPVTQRLPNARGEHIELLWPRRVGFDDRNRRRHRLPADPDVVIRVSIVMPRDLIERRHKAHSTTTDADVRVPRSRRVSARFDGARKLDREYNSQSRSQGRYPKWLQYSRG